MNTTNMVPRDMTLQIHGEHTGSFASLTRKSSPGRQRQHAGRVCSPNFSRCFGFFTWLICFGMLTPLTAVIAAGPPPKDPPAIVAQTANESNFNTVTLTPKAEERLKIKTVAVEKKSVPLTRLFGGEVMMALGAANVAGTSQSILPLLPSMTPADRVRLAESQVDADGAISAARVQLEAAMIALQRTERMLRDQSGSQRAVDEARAQANVAESELSRATARRGLLGPDVLPGATPMTIWVRVPVYVGDLRRIDAAASARVGSLGASWDDPGLLAKPADAPPSANPAASSVDLFFELENKDHRFRLGERVGVNVALKTADESLVVPWAGVLIDINGGTWVYENTADHVFVRRRVQVRRVAGELAVLASGPAVGSKIVTDGAAELFGTEVGFSK